jgi:hypothetical protein
MAQRVTGRPAGGVAQRSAVPGGVARDRPPGGRRGAPVTRAGYDMNVRLLLLVQQ